MLLFCITFHIFQQETVLPVLQWVLPCLWSGQRSHVPWSGLAAGREVDCVAMNGGGSARPDLSARLASEQWFMVWDKVRQTTLHVCVFLSVVLFTLRTAGEQGWWYGRLGKQETAGPSRLILPTLPLCWHITASCCGHGMAASEARWRAQTLVPGTAFTYYGCLCCVQLTIWSNREVMAAGNRPRPTLQAISYRPDHFIYIYI